MTTLEELLASYLDLAHHLNPLRHPIDAPPELRRLALDYELVRFAGRRVTTAEEQRAIGRWRTIRMAVRSMRPRRRAAGSAGPNARRP